MVRHVLLTQLLKIHLAGNVLFNVEQLIADPIKKTSKEVILNACDLRNDDWAQKVRLRIEGAVSDLHAADAQYHKVCMSLFRGSKNIDRSKDDTEQHDEAFTMLVKDMAEDRSRLWNSIELHNLYTDYKGDKLSRRQLLKNLSEDSGSDLLLVMSGNGVATIVVFRIKSIQCLEISFDHG